MDVVGTKGIVQFKTPVPNVIATIIDVQTISSMRQGQLVVVMMMTTAQNQKMSANHSYVMIASSAWLNESKAAAMT